ncbi:MAG: pyrimidine reductase family protein [Acidimicrobiales bacterium]|nr:pyrimidine reductase family protein [Acidimicrobiales bacterium]
MRQLLPHPVDPVDLADALADDRDATDRPWVIALDVSSADGAATVGGRSGGLGGPADRAAFAAVRALADAVVVGAATVAIERYRPVRTAAALAAGRAGRGQPPHPAAVIVSARLSVPPDLPLLVDDDGAGPRPLIVHGADAPSDARRALAGRADLVELPTGPGGIDLARLLRVLADRGVATAVLEGGPRLTGAFLAADLVDEAHVTLDPRLVGGDGPRVAVGPGPGDDRPWTTRALLEDDGVLFWRVRRRR